MPAITREDIIVVDTVSKNSYGDLVWTDKEGKEYKVSEKRVQYFDKVILPGAAVNLGFAEGYGKEYVYSAVAVGDVLPEPVKTGGILLEHKQEIDKALLKPKQPEYAPQEIGMWFKELGLRIGDGALDRDYPKVAVAIKTKYYQRMSEVTGISFK